MEKRGNSGLKLKETLLVKGAVKPLSSCLGKLITQLREKQQRKDINKQQLGNVLNSQQAEAITEGRDGEVACWGNTLPVLILRRITPVFAGPQEKNTKNK